MFKQLISSWYNQSRTIMNTSYLWGGLRRHWETRQFQNGVDGLGKTDGVTSKAVALDWGEEEKKEGEECCL